MRPLKYKLEIGKRWGRLTIVGLVKRDSFGISRFKCKCDCGRSAVLRSNHFRPGRRFCSRKCQLLGKVRVKNLVGRKFTRWTVLAPAGISKRTGAAKWRCECSCGAKRVLDGNALVAKSTRSCGCLLKDQRRAGRSPAELARDRKRAHLAWRRRNKAYLRAQTIKHRMRRAKATPVWLTEAHWAEMNALYEKARKMSLRNGTLYEVDHIIPINGKNVCGLHVPWNLQILTKRKNVRKSNRYAEHSGD